MLWSRLVKWFSFLPLWVHLHKAFGVGVHTKRDKFLIVIVNRIEMLQEKISEEEVAIVVSIQWVLGDCELADSLALMEISGRA